LDDLHQVTALGARHAPFGGVPRGVDDEWDARDLHFRFIGPFYPSPGAVGRERRRKCAAVQTFARLSGYAAAGLRTCEAWMRLPLLLSRIGWPALIGFAHPLGQSHGRSFFAVRGVHFAYSG